MAICPICEGEMRDGISCRPDPLVIRGDLYEPIRWGDESRYGRRHVTMRCGDCGAPPGAVHHQGCDVEECPLCYGQAISCDCDEPPEWDHDWFRTGCPTRSAGSIP